MKVTFDPRYNIAYIAFRDEVEEVESLCVEEDINIDLAPNGSIHGTELLNADAQLGRLMLQT